MVELFLHALERFLQFFDPLGYHLHFVPFFGDIHLLSSKPPYLFGGGIAGLPQTLHFLNQALSLTIQPLERLYVERKTPVPQPFAGRLDVFTQIGKIEHVIENSP